MKFHKTLCLLIRLSSISCKCLNIREGWNEVKAPVIFHDAVNSQNMNSARREESQASKKVAQFNKLAFITRNTILMKLRRERCLFFLFEKLSLFSLAP